MAASNIMDKQKLSAIFFFMGYQKLVILWWEDTFLITKKAHNPVAWHYVDLNRIQWASNLLQPENYLIHICYNIANHFWGYCIFIVVFGPGNF